MKHYYKSCAFALLFLYSSTVLAAHYQLFHEDGSQVQDYDYHISHLQPGDSVEFSDGRRFIIKQIIGEGRNNKILDIGNGRVLRVPLRSGYQGKYSYTAYLEAYYEGASRLANAEVPVVKVDFKNSLKSEYIISEQLDIRWTFEEFAETFARNSTDATYQQAAEELIKFARETAHVERIGDLHAGNLGYTSRGWVIFDFSDDVKSYRPGLFTSPSTAGDAKKNLFNTNEFMHEKLQLLPNTLTEQLEKAIAEARTGIKHPLTNICSKFVEILVK